MAPRITWKRAVWALLVLSGIAILLYAGVTDRFSGVWRALVNEQTHTALFIGLFLILPMFGFPISVFLLLIGVKFNMLPGMAVMFGGMAFHIALSYPAANTLLRPMLEKTLNNTRYRMPQFSRRGFVGPSIIFMSVPGLSYTMKNYIFSLSGVPFRYYFIIGWLSQAILGIPVIIAGDMAQRRHLWAVAIFFVLAAGIYMLYHWWRRRHSGSASR